jgi:hypothetical protein
LRPPWSDVHVAFGRVHHAAVVLRYRAGWPAVEVRRCYRELIGAIVRHRRAAGRLAGVFGHFLKVMRSYWPGPFRCYEVDGLPRTNNDLEQFFGSYRYHERRGSGRKVACPGTVVRGSARLTASAATRLRPIEVTDLMPRDLAAWRDLRARLERREAVRTLGRRFRRDPVAYLRSLEESLIKGDVPPWQKRAWLELEGGLRVMHATGSSAAVQDRLRQMTAKAPRDDQPLVGVLISWKGRIDLSGTDVR